MFKRPNQRVLGVENLERRLVLVSNVDIDVINGDLIIQGDDEPSGLTVEAVPDATGEPQRGVFEIIPNAETSLDGLPPGQPLIVNGVVGSMAFNMKGGDDQTQVLGGQTRLRGGITVENSGGNDLFDVSDLRLRAPVNINNADGVGNASFQNVGIFLPINPPGAPDPPPALDLIGGSLGFTFGTVRGSIHVDGRGAGSVDLNDIAIVKPFDKASPKLFTAATVNDSSKFVIRFAQTEGDVDYFTVKLKQPLMIPDFRIDGSKVDGGVTVGSDYNLKAEIKDSKVTENVTLNFAKVKVKYVPLNPTDDNVKVEGSTIGGLQVTQGTDTGRVTVEGSRVKGAAGIKYSTPVESKNEPRVAGAENGAQSAVRIVSSRVDGDLTVSTGGPLHASATRGSNIQEWKIEIDGLSGGDTSASSLVQVHDSRVSLLKVDTNNLAADVDISNSKIPQGASSSHKGEIDVLAWSWGMRDSTLGDVDIDSTSAVDFSSQSSTAAAVDMFIKIGSIDGESRDKSSVSVQDSRLDRLSVDTRGAAADVDISDSKIPQGVDHKHKNEIDVLAWSWGMSNSSVGPVSVRSVGANLDFSSNNSTAAAVDYYLKIGSIKGESVDGAEPNGSSSIAIQSSRIGQLTVDTKGGTADVDITDSKIPEGVDHKHKNEIDILAWSWGMRNSRVGPVSVRSVGANLDFSSTNSTAAAVDYYLKIGSIKGESNDRAQANGSSNIAIQGSRVGQLTVDTRGGTADVNVTNSTIPQGVDHKHKNEIDVLSWSWGMSNSDVGTVNLDSRGATVDFTSTNSKAAAADFFIKIGSIEGESSDDRSSISVLNSRLDQLSVNTRGAAADVDISNSTIPQGVDHKHKNEIDVLSWSWGMSNSNVGPVTIHSRGATADIRAVNSTAAAFDMYIKIDTIPGESDDRRVANANGENGDSNHVELVNTRVRGPLRIVSRGRATDDVFLSGVRVDGETTLRVGGGNDRATILDSVFRQFAELNGGAGRSDELVLQGNRFLVDPEIINWELPDERV